MDSQGTRQVSVTGSVKAGRRSARRRRQPYAWLGASALTLGVGVALAGAGTAHADDSPSVDSAASTKASAPAASRGMSRGASAVKPTGAAASVAPAQNRTVSPPATVARSSAGSAASADRRAATAFGIVGPSRAQTAGPTADVPTGTAPAHAEPAAPLPTAAASQATVNSPVVNPTGNSARAVFRTSTPPQAIRGFILSRTAMIPRTTIDVQGKPITVGNALLASAFFNGHNGSGPGLAGLNAYVSRQLAASTLGGTNTDPVDFTITNWTTPYSVSGQTLYGPGGDYQIAYTTSEFIRTTGLAEPGTATASPGGPYLATTYAAGTSLGSPFAPADSLRLSQNVPTDAEANSGNCSTFGGASCFDRATYQTTIRFNKAGYYPVGLETTLNTASPGAVALNPTGTTLYVANRGGSTISEFNTASNTPTGININLTGRAPQSIAVDPATGFIYVTQTQDANGNPYGHVDVINPTTNSVAQTLGLGDFSNGIGLGGAAGIAIGTVNGLGTVAAIAIPEYGTVALPVIQASGLLQTNYTSYSTNGTGSSNQPTGVSLAGGSLWETNTTQNSVKQFVYNAGFKQWGVGAQFQNQGGLNAPTGIAVSPTYLAYVANSGSNTVTVLKSDNTVVATVVVGDNPTAVAIAPDQNNPGNYLVFVTNAGSNTMSVINGTNAGGAAANTVVATWATGANPAAVAISPSSATLKGAKTVYVGNLDGQSTGVYGWADHGSNSTLASDSAYSVSLGTSKTFYKLPDNPVPGGGLVPGATYYTQGPYLTCSTGSGSAGGGCAIPDNNTARFLDPPNTTPAALINTSTDAATAQSYLLQNLVNSDLSNAQFTFADPVGCASTLNVGGGRLACSGYVAPVLVPGVDVLNNPYPIATPANPNASETWAYTTAYSNASSTTEATATQIGADYKILPDLTLKAQKTWTGTTGVTTTATDSFSKSITLNVPPQYEAWAYESVPLIGMYGNWTVTQGNTTYTLNNVWYNLPTSSLSVTQPPVYQSQAICYSTDKGCKDAVANGDWQAGIKDANGAPYNPWAVPVDQFLPLPVNYTKSSATVVP